MKCELPDQITFKLDENELSHIKSMAESIHQCPIRSKGRPYSVVYKSVFNGVILEFALERQGAIKNNSEFDSLNPDTYCWDVEWRGLRAEVKCVSDPDQAPENRKQKWVTFPISMIETFIRNITRDPKSVDIIIFGCYNKVSEDTYECKWRLVAPTNTFKKSVKKCNPSYKSSYDRSGSLKYFYSHHQETRSIYNKDL